MGKKRQYLEAEKRNIMKKGINLAIIPARGGSKGIKKKI